MTEVPARLAVLGADGFIGSHVVEEAVGRGIGVRAICVKDPWRLETISCGAKLRVPGGRWWDRSFQDQLSEGLDGVEALALLAYSPPPNRDSAAWKQHELEVNLKGVRWIAGLAAGLGVRVVFASSASVYAPWRAEAVGEEAEPRPMTPYGVAKAAAEEDVRAAGAGGCALRLATVFGPREDGPRAVPSFIRQYLRGADPVVHNDGSDVNDYVHVRDVARAFLLACLDRPPDDGEPINIGSGVGRSTLEVLDVVATALNQPPRYRSVTSPRAQTRLVLRCQRARQTLGFAPVEAFDAGVSEEARWLSRRYAAA